MLDLGAEHKISHMATTGCHAERGVIFLNCEIDADSYSHFVCSMSYLDQCPDVKEIKIMINCPGGDVTYTFGMYDIIRFASKPVVTIGSGEVCSGAVLILAAGHKRVVTDNTVVMLHQGSFDMPERYSEIEDRMKWSKWAEDRYDFLLAKHSNKTARQWKNIMKRKSEYYLFGGEQIIKEGLADSVLTEDNFKSLIDNAPL